MLAGNWKMNKLNRELAGFFATFFESVGWHRDDSISDRIDVLFAVPPTLMAQAVPLAEPSGVRIAAQNIHWEPSGAFTGEISLPMITEAGVTATLIGHSERRQYFAETDESVARKTRAALLADVMPVVCIGETLEQREAGLTQEVVSRQVKAALNGIEDPKDLVLAYEPVWAIGTGRSATAAQAQEVHAEIRHLLRAIYGQSIGSNVRVLYGGSATPQNVEDLLAQKDIDGALVGGASLKPEDFAKMVRAGL
ncbi:MAG: triose-phosphate isomerase [Deltaproteobacteria bacterium]|nr:triose-phosphate isomerase [Deltaproteobacteria bacterium]